MDNGNRTAVIARTLRHSAWTSSSGTHSVPRVPAAPWPPASRRDASGHRVALTYAPPEAHAAPANFEPQCGDGDVPWDVDPFDQSAVVEAAQLMATYKYSEESARNIEALTPIAKRWIEGGARALSDEDLANVYKLGWKPTSELNANPEVRAKVNTALSFKNAVWAPKGNNQGEYETPLPSASRARLTRFEAGVEVQSLAAIIVGVLIVILVVDFPTPAY